MKKIVFYIAGPYRGPDSWTVEKNIRNAEDVSFHVWTRGHVPICPHTMTRFFDRTLTDKIWIEGTLELMRRCDAVLVLPNSGDSEGTQGEIIEALSIGISVFFLDSTNQLDVFNSTIDAELAMSKPRLTGGTAV